jgi:hypothetical protein
MISEVMNKALVLMCRELNGLVLMLAMYQL